MSSWNSNRKGWKVGKRKMYLEYSNGLSQEKGIRTPLSGVLENRYLIIISALKIMFIFSLDMQHFYISSDKRGSLCSAWLQISKDSCLVQVWQVGEWQGEQERPAEPKSFLLLRHTPGTRWSGGAFMLQGVWARDTNGPERQARMASWFQVLP